MSFSNHTGNLENQTFSTGPNSLVFMPCEWVSFCISQKPIGGPTITLRIKRIQERHGTRIYLSGELRYAHLADVHAEIEQAGQPASLDLEEVDVVDIDGVRLLNECQAQGIQVVNCAPYIREWMLQEKRAAQDEI